MNLFEVLVFIDNYRYAHGGLVPTTREIRRGCNVDAFECLIKLERRGHIQLNSRLERAYVRKGPSYGFRADWEKS